MEANGDCAKCAYPRRKDYKHTCSRAYGYGRRAGPVKPNDRGSRAGTMLTIGFNGEHLCTARSTRKQHSAFTHLTASDCLWVSLAGASPPQEPAVQPESVERMRLHDSTPTAAEPAVAAAAESSSVERTSSNRRDRSCSGSRSRSRSPCISPGEQEAARAPPRAASPVADQAAALPTGEGSGEAQAASRGGEGGMLSAVLSPTRLPSTLPEDPASPAGRRVRAELRESLCAFASRTGRARTCPRRGKQLSSTCLRRRAS